MHGVQATRKDTRTDTHERVWTARLACFAGPLPLGTGSWTNKLLAVPPVSLLAGGEIVHQIGLSTGALAVHWQPAAVVALLNLKHSSCEPRALSTLNLSLSLSVSLSLCLVCKKFNLAFFLSLWQEQRQQRGSSTSTSSDIKRKK